MTGALALLAVSQPPLTAQGRRGEIDAMRRRPVRPQKQPKPPKAGKGADQRPIDQLARMSPEERRQALDKLPPERRSQVESRLETYNKLSPAQREALQGRYDMFKQLPPERQEAVRKAFQKFTKESPERQAALRAELQQIRTLPIEERKARLSSAEFKGQFNKSEQQIISEMAELP